MSLLWSIVTSWAEANERSVAYVARRIGLSRSGLDRWKSLSDLPRREYLDALSGLTGQPYRDVLRAALIDAGYLDDEVVVSTRATVVDDESGEAVGARPESAGRSRAPRSARRGRPRGPRPQTPADEGRSR